MCRPVMAYSSHYNCTGVHRRMIFKLLTVGCSSKNVSFNAKCRITPPGERAMTMIFLLIIFPREY